MKKYYVLEAELSFGFAGFIKKAFLTSEQADQALEQLKKRYRNITSCNIDIVEAHNKKEAESGCKSMFAGDFAGIDRKKV